MNGNIDFNTIMHESTLPATNSSILDNYLALKQRELKPNKMKLVFPNSISETLKLSRKCLPKKNIIEQNNGKKKKNILHNNSTTLLYLNEKDNDEKQLNIFNYEGKNNSNHSPLKVKYSWQDLDHWIPPSVKNKINDTQNNLKTNTNETNTDCKIKYSWPVMGLGSQTSSSLINKNDQSDDDNSYCKCSIKYSWQVVGTGTQVSLLDDNLKLLHNDYWNGKVIMSNKYKIIPNQHNYGNEKSINNFHAYNKKKNPIYYSQITQTSADKNFQIELTNCQLKYSWQNLTKPYLHSNNSTLESKKYKNII